MHYIPRFLLPPVESFFLFGPRGTGKSTWLLHTFPNALRLDLLDREIERKFLAKPERLLEFVAPLNYGDVCIIDEVQRVPELIPVVHSLIEEKRGIQFILTGSSARKLRRSLGDLLGGVDKLKAYISVYLKEEVQAEGLVRQIGDFARFILDGVKPSSSGLGYKPLC